MKVEDAIKGIVTYRKLIHEENYWNNPERLSDVMAKLAVYNAYLADNIATFHKEASEKQSVVFMEARKEVGVTEAERIAKAESLNERETYEKCKYIYTATGNLITVLQSRLKVIEQQRKDESL
jgi:uncharacterized NAD(P)/FAD-binding protein YdhS